MLLYSGEQFVPLFTNHNMAIWLYYNTNTSICIHTTDSQLETGMIPYNLQMRTSGRSVCKKGVARRWAWTGGGSVHKVFPYHHCVIQDPCRYAHWTQSYTRDENSSYRSRECHPRSDLFHATINGHLFVLILRIPRGKVNLVWQRRTVHVFSHLLVFGSRRVAGEAGIDCGVQRTHTCSGSLHPARPRG